MGVRQDHYSKENLFFCNLTNKYMYARKKGAKIIIKKKKTVLGLIVVKLERRSFLWCFSLYIRLFFARFTWGLGNEG